MERPVIPTGVKSVDLLLGGGVPAGSFVLLYGPPSTFKSEFLATSAFVNIALKTGKLTPPRKVKIPKDTWYVCLSKSPHDITSAVKNNFSKKFSELFEKHVKFLDFSKQYSSFVGSIWSGKEKPDSRKLLLQVVNSIKKVAQDSQVFIYTLTDVARLLQDKPLELLSFVEGLRSASHHWGGVVYAILRKGSLPPAVEEDVLSSCDGTFLFEVEKVGDSERYSMTLLAMSGVPTSVLGQVFEVSVGPDGFHAQAVKSILGV